MKMNQFYYQTFHQLLIGSIYLKMQIQVELNQCIIQETNLRLRKDHCSNNNSISEILLNAPAESNNFYSAPGC